MDKQNETQQEIERLKQVVNMVARINQDNCVAMQAAFIEWQHGGGAEAAMKWIANTLWGPGLIPDPEEPYGTEAQAWFDSHRAEPFPKCFCGRPSNILGMRGKGFCCDEHYQQYKAVVSDSFQRYLRTGKFE